MKANDLRELTQVELEQKYHDFKDELFNLKFQLATGQLENTARIRTVKRDIAKILTIMSERKLGEGARPRRLTKEKRRVRSMKAPRQG
ncbi:MAG: 50S ribosomal protein L29 [Candidatus Wallbacteria bacterium HGW-Wallbacteria-1]|jgi:large subunit ribosomal protein L29|uniref:Large ribosomal subunit protein uL29 n=1 Tax=Candidatus Wallbacteria bacterium HGW-Wallbacteria-1 TaxID=2013854 RepID=A0A2N1PSV8_9BACT|nr:MAG: 50S ribosomal protein L29 [Candidatus Wallbacteria bacterium HGW-Wallbacteria-1]